MIPKQIFQTWKTKKISKDFEILINSWKNNNPGFKFYFYDDKDCEIFLKKFDKKIFETYRKIIPGAFRADLWRFTTLYVFGGFYCDVDTLCLGRIENFIKEETEFIAPIDLNLDAEKHNLFNSFFGCVPGSAIMKNCIDMIVYNVENNITNIPALDFSSCGVLGRATNKFLNLSETSSFIGKAGFFQNIHLLKFEKEKEFVTDSCGNILFQNKNGNKEIIDLFHKEQNKHSVKSWFNSKVWIAKKIFL